MFFAAGCHMIYNKVSGHTVNIHNWLSAARLRTVRLSVVCCADSDVPREPGRCVAHVFAACSEGRNIMQG